MNRLRPQSRLGFTLVEILIVVGIIALLAAIAIGVIGRTVTNARVARTKTTIKKIDEMLRKRMAAFERGLKKEDRPGILPEYARRHFYGQYGERALPRDAAIVAGRKRLFKEYFAQQFDDFASEDKAAGNVPVPNPAGSHDPVTESSEAMYFFLTSLKSNAYGIDSVEAGEFTSSEVADTDGDGLLEFIDGWGQPLRFYRWPTRLIRPQASGSEGTAGKATINTSLAAKYLITTLPTHLEGPTNDIPSNLIAQDPDDPRGLLSGAIASPLYSNAEFESYRHTSDTYHMPLIVSPGPDGRLGLYEPYDSTNFGRLAQPIINASTPTDPNPDLFDNITNHKDAAGGGGN